MNKPWEDFTSQTAELLPWEDFQTPKKPLQGQEKDGSYIGQLVSNVPESAYKYGKDILQTITHPVQTLGGLGKIALANNYMGSNDIGSGIARLMGKSEQFEGLKKEGEESIQSFANLLEERYGGWENVKKTMKDDPVGFLADISTVFTGAGGVAGKTSNVGKVSSAIGKYSDPLNLASATIKAPLKAIPKEVPIRLYQSALKPSTTLKESERLKRITTALEEGLPLTSGLKKSKNIIESINDEITKRINEHTTQNVTIFRDKALEPVESLKQKYLSEKALPSEAVGEVESVIKEFKNQPEQIPISQAQKFKQNLYKDLSDFYGKSKKTGTIKPNEWAEVRKELAMGLKNELEDVFPEIKALNKREGSLIELNKSLEQAVNRIENRNIFSLIGGMYGTAGGAIGGPQGALALMLANYVINNPRVNSRLSIVLYKAKQAQLARGKYTIPRQVSFQSGRATEGGGELPENP